MSIATETQRVVESVSHNVDAIIDSEASLSEEERRLAKDAWRRDLERLAAAAVAPGITESEALSMLIALNRIYLILWAVLDKQVGTGQKGGKYNFKQAALRMVAVKHAEAIAAVVTSDDPVEAITEASTSVSGVLIDKRGMKSASLSDADRAMAALMPDIDPTKPAN